ncbi:hypothetical protein [Roseateles sp.]|jgi:hypothetical protein|uniref:hypothetical protein n=1 Tax=Roseateles sp. TaxID=1971397 RepID=UPI00391B62C2
MGQPYASRAGQSAAIVKAFRFGGFRLEAVADQGLLFGDSALAYESKRLRTALPSGNNTGLQQVHGEAVRRREQLLRAQGPPAQRKSALWLRRRQMTCKVGLGTINSHGRQTLILLL